MVRCGICAVSTLRMCFYACRISLISGLSRFAGSAVETVVVIRSLEFVFVFHWWMQTVLYW